MKTEQEIKDILDEANGMYEIVSCGHDLHRLDGIVDALDFALGNLASWELL